MSANPAPTEQASDTFCVLPWLHMATYTDGSLLLCCVAKNELNLNLNDTKLAEAWNSKAMRGTRQRMLVGKKVSACESCYTEERNGFRSHRQAEALAWAERFGQDFIQQRIEQTQRDGSLPAGLVALDLRLGNTCNLQCIMCRPQDSSKWVKLGQELASQAQDPTLAQDWKHRGRIDLTKFKWFQSEEFLRSFRQVLPEMRELIIGGGEPLLLAEHSKLLDLCLENGHASHIQIRYHSNGTHLHPRVFEQWRHFKLVEFFVSIDGVGPRNEYFRYPCDWDGLTTNLRTLDNYPHGNLKIMVLASVHALNFYYLMDLAEWLVRQDFKLVSKGFNGYFLPGLVHYPSYLSVQLYPEEVKRQIATRVEAFEKTSKKPSRKMAGLVNFMNERARPELLPTLREYLVRVDKSRGTRFDRAFPELNAFLGVY